MADMTPDEIIQHVAADLKAHPPRLSHAQARVIGIVAEAIRADPAGRKDYVRAAFSSGSGDSAAVRAAAAAIRAAAGDASKTDAEAGAAVAAARAANAVSLAARGRT